MKLLAGHVLDKLAELPADSVHCVVTSPPYWGLRSYGTEPQVWGGDPGHEHEWVATRGDVIVGNCPSRKSTLGTNGGHGPLPGDKYESGRAEAANHGASCTCGAWLGELGREPAPELYVRHMVDVFRAVRRVLRPDGTLWLNLGDSYAADDYARGVKQKDLVGIPWRVAFALRADGWYLRSDIIWHKPDAMPESMTDRPTKAHEYVFLLARRSRYFYDSHAIKEPVVDRRSILGRSGSARDRLYAATGDHGAGRYRSNLHRQSPRSERNARTVWLINKARCTEEHFAAMPGVLAERCILAGTSAHGACSSCGAPWRREFRKGDLVSSDGRAGACTTIHQASVGNAVSRSREATGSATSYYGMARRERFDAGWAPTCRCEACQIKPCVVLDPFSGTGTTGKAAARLGRDYIGIEISAKYSRIAERRLTRVADGPLFGDAGSDK